MLQFWQTGLLSDAQQVLAHLRSALRVSQHRSTWRFYIHRYESSLDTAVGMPQQPAQHGINRFRMERRQCIGWIGFKPEELLTTFNPRRPCRVILSGR